MQFSNIAVPALFAALTSAITVQTVEVTSLTVRNIHDSIASTSFYINPGQVYCAYSGVPTSAVSCSEKSYSFFIEQNSLASYNLTIYNQTGVAIGLWQEQQVAPICRAGGSDATDYVCTSPSSLEYKLRFDGQA